MPFEEARSQILDILGADHLRELLLEFMTFYEPIESRTYVSDEIERFLHTLFEFDYQLQFCEKCYQMTNHLDGVCQKCKKE